MRRVRTRRQCAIAGFTLVEALIATALMAAILSALAMVTAQWLPNWNRGFASVQRNELLALGLERLVADLSAAEFIPGGQDNPMPVFNGTESSIQFARTAIGPNTRAGLEIVQIAEIAGEFGPVMVRRRARYVPVDQMRPTFGDPVVLVRAPHRVSFAYAGMDRVWRNTWQNVSLLPKAVRVQVRDGGTGRILSVSTAATIHVDMPANCILAEVVDDCLKRETRAEQGEGPSSSGAPRGTQ
jgi:general secretion pathway protein J